MRPNRVRLGDSTGRYNPRAVLARAVSDLRVQRSRDGRTARGPEIRNGADGEDRHTDKARRGSGLGSGRQQEEDRDRQRRGARTQGLAQAAVRRIGSARSAAATGIPVGLGDHHVAEHDDAGMRVRMTLRDDTLQREQREQTQRHYVAPTQPGATLMATGGAGHAMLLGQVHSGASRFPDTRTNGHAVTSPHAARRDLAHQGLGGAVPLPATVA